MTEGASRCPSPCPGAAWTPGALESVDRLEEPVELAVGRLLALPAVIHPPGGRLLQRRRDGEGEVLRVVKQASRVLEPLQDRPRGLLARHSGHPDPPPPSGRGRGYVDESVL